MHILFAMVLLASGPVAVAGKEYPTQQVCEEHLERFSQAVAFQFRRNIGATFEVRCMPTGQNDI